MRALSLSDHDPEPAGEQEGFIIKAIVVSNKKLEAWFAKTLEKEIWDVVELKRHTMGKVNA